MKRLAPGFSLVEVLIAIAVSSFILAGTISVLALSRDRFATNESIARLHDTARQALSLLVPQIEAAGDFGFSREPHALQFVRGANPDQVLATGVALRAAMPAALVVPVAGLPASAHECGVNFAVDVFAPAEADASLNCEPAAAAGGVRAGTDVLTVRYAGPVAPPRAGRVQLYTDRLTSQSRQLLFADGVVPGPLDEHHEVRDLEVHIFYVATHSVARRNWPALRLKSLTEIAGAVRFRDEELLPGVEDLQVELGVAPPGAPEGTLQFVVPGHALARTGRVIAVRLWLRVRSDSTEAGFRDTQTYAYSDTSYQPDPADRGHRRVLIERTVALRSALP
jgi:prepilin-type N-terminal cleavage/methylation domain-containing protein